MKRILCLAICVLAAFLACACGDGDTQPTGTTEAEPTAAAADETAPTEAAESVGSGLMAFMNRFDDNPTVGDRLIYEDEKITVSVHGINYAVTAGPELHLVIDNHLDRDITVQAPYAVINDYMMTPELSMTVPAEKSAGGNLCLSYTNLAYADITCIKNIDFALRVVETKNYNPIFTTDIISLDTSVADGEKEEYDESGQIAYDDNDIRIVFKNQPSYGAKSDENLSPVYMSDGNAVLLVYIYNGTDRSISVQTGDVTVNGYDLTSVMNRTVLPGRRAVDTVTFYRMDLDEHSIDAIDSVKVSFEIKDAETWESIYSTDMIGVDLQQKTEETAE